MQGRPQGQLQMHELTDMRLLLPPMQVCPACLHVRDTHSPQVLQMALQVSSGWMLMGELQAPKSRRLRSFSSWSLCPLGKLLMHELPTMPRCIWGTPTHRRCCGWRYSCRRIRWWKLDVSIKPHVTVLLKNQYDGIHFRLHHFSLTKSVHHFEWEGIKQNYWFF